MTASLQRTTELDLARDFIETTGTHLFLTGKAGTGKTTFLHQLKERAAKRMIVTAPTGVAAMNAGGVTLHSFFQLPFGPIVPGMRQGPTYRFARDKINIIKSLDLLVIDEVSMVRADMLDGVDAVLRRYRNPHLPFGGVQLLLIGDLHQLPPVIKPDEWAMLSGHYRSAYFFDSLALMQAGFVGLELTQVFRQRQTEFIELLNAVREERWTEEVLSALNERYREQIPDDVASRAITLTTHNHKADRINQQQLSGLSGTTQTYQAVVEGDFPEAIYPADPKLKLAVDARVMFIRNDSSPEKRFFNGKMARVVGVSGDSVEVECDDGLRLTVETDTWQNVKYQVNPETKAIDEQVLGQFSQLPLRHAWAITIHKSQGLTFEQAIIDAEDAFSQGQTYVALSRCKSLEGLWLSTPVRVPTVSADDSLVQFDQFLLEQKPGSAELNNAQQRYQQQLIINAFDFSELAAQLQQWHRMLQGQSQLLSNVDANSLKEQLVEFRQQLVAVSEKFLRQLPRYFETGMPEDNAELLARLTKAGDYFVPHLQHWQSKLAQFEFSSDNANDSKRLSRQVEQMHELVTRQLAAHTSLQQGFRVSSYLKAVAEACLSKAPAPGKAKALVLTESDVPYPALFEKLRHWRKQVADELGSPAYTVLTQKALVQVVCYLPANESALLALDGVGPKTVERYGAALLAQVADFCRDTGVDQAAYRYQAPAAVVSGTANSELKGDNSEPAASHSVTSKGEASYVQSLVLYKELRDVAQVADQRALAVSTIESHLTQALAEGLIALVDLMPDAQRRNVIEQQLSMSEGGALKPVKEALGDNFSYGEIRWVQTAHKMDAASEN